MKTWFTQRHVTVMALLVPCLMLVWAWRETSWSWKELWRTPTQLGDAWMKKGDYENAATAYDDPYRKGIARFKAGQFEEASVEFTRVSTAEAAYNRGNAFIMLGQYEAAIQSYESAITQRPDWDEAQQNLTLARLRADRVKQEGGEGTGGKLGADDIVLSTGNNNQTQGATETTEGAPISDEEMRALWLRRVQTRPADFLRAKFAYQAAQIVEEPSR